MLVDSFNQHPNYSNHVRIHSFYTPTRLPPKNKNKKSTHQVVPHEEMPQRGQDQREDLGRGVEVRAEKDEGQWEERRDDGAELFWICLVVV